MVEASSTPITSLLFALRRKHIFHASVAFAAILAEILTVILPVIPFQSSTSYIAWNVSAYLSVAILLFMLFTLISVFIRRKSPKIPRQPHTLAAVISYVSASRMSHEFHSRSVGVASALDPNLRKGRRYRFGKADWCDAFGTWVIDFDERESCWSS